jgi:hypothetical protein
VFVSGVAAIALGDVDADGDTDLLAASQNGRLSVLRNTGLGSWLLAGGITIPTAARALTLVDMDGDNDLDCVVADYNFALNTYFNGGTGPLAAPSAGTATDLLHAYPNPATGRVQLSLPPAATRAELLDALGRTVRTVAAQGGAVTLDVTGLAPGLYRWRVPGGAPVGALLVE